MGTPEQKLVALSHSPTTFKQRVFHKALLNLFRQQYGRGSVQLPKKVVPYVGLMRSLMRGLIRPYAAKTLAKSYAKRYAGASWGCLRLTVDGMN